MIPRHTAPVLGVAVLLTAVAGDVCAQADAGPPAIHYTVPGMDTVRVIRDVRYKTATVNARAGVPLALDVYLVPGGTRAPGLVFVHGGLVAGTAPHAKEWPSYRSWGRIAAASGMVGVVLDHRMNTNDVVDQAGGDLLDAVAHVRAHAGEYGLDPDRLCVAFYSAGGPISSVVLRRATPYVRCVVLYYPYLDLEHLSRTTPFRGPLPVARIDSLRGYSPRAALARGADSLPPIFLARAGRDAIPFLNESVDRFVAEALRRNVVLDLVNHASGVHGFDIETRDERTRDIIAQTLRFARRHLGLEGDSLTR
jgi:acetyl esterase/lipase